MEGKHAFERADWDLDLPSLKPLGLNCLLNTHVSHSHALAVDRCIEVGAPAGSAVLPCGQLWTHCRTDCQAVLPIDCSPSCGAHWHTAAVLARQPCHTYVGYAGRPSGCTVQPVTITVQQYSVVPKCAFGRRGMWDPTYADRA